MTRSFMWEIFFVRVTVAEKVATGNRINRFHERSLSCTSTRPLFLCDKTGLSLLLVPLALC